MTNEQKYAEVLKALGAVLLDKDIAISCKDYRIQELEKKLEAAEAERDKVRAEFGILEHSYEALIATFEQNGGRM